MKIQNDQSVLSVHQLSGASESGPRSFRTWSLDNVNLVRRFHFSKCSHNQTVIVFHIRKLWQLQKTFFSYGNLIQQSDIDILLIHTEYKQELIALW